MFLAGASLAQSGDIEGTIVIKRKLTKRNITPAASLYQRGAAVDLALDREADPLSFERSRVVIYVEGQLPSKPVAATLEQKNRRFLPDTLVVPVGSTVSFPNLDPIFHNVFSLSRPSRFDLGNYPKGQTRAVAFSKPGVVFVGCHLHPNMGATIVVSPNRWCTKSDPAGRFTLRDAPPGNLTVVAWHKAAGSFRETLRIPETGAAHVQFMIPLEEPGPVNAIARR
jgi:plastocyanin